MSRPSKFDYYLQIAKDVASRSTCLRRHYGAVIVKDDRIVATGYNGSPRGEENCCDRGTCPRIAKQIAHNTGDYSECCSVHAEQNAIIHASFNDMKDATMYLVGMDAETGDTLKDISCCPICSRMVKNAGIKEVLTPQSITIYGELDGPIVMDSRDVPTISVEPRHGRCYLKEGVELQYTPEDLYKYMVCIDRAVNEARKQNPWIYDDDERVDYIFEAIAIYLGYDMGTQIIPFFKMNAPEIFDKIEFVYGYGDGKPRTVYFYNRDGKPIWIPIDYDLESKLYDAVKLVQHFRNSNQLEEYSMHLFLLPLIVRVIE